MHEVVRVSKGALHRSVDQPSKAAQRSVGRVVPRVSTLYNRDPIWLIGPPPGKCPDVL